LKSLRTRAVRGKRQHYRRSGTALTLIAEFSSKVFWPPTNWLEGDIGWRATFGLL
jgi:hypothetical protein